MTDIQGLGGDASDNCAIDSLYYYDIQSGFLSNRHKPEPSLAVDSCAQ